MVTESERETWVGKGDNERVWVREREGERMREIWVGESDIVKCQG